MPERARGGVLTLSSSTDTRTRTRTGTTCFFLTNLCCVAKKLNDNNSEKMIGRTPTQQILRPSSKIQIVIAREENTNNKYINNHVRRRKSTRCRQ